MPPHRWFLIGPKRSGSEIHQDPLGTSAWNTSVQGHKRWLLIPPAPGLTKKFVRAKHLRKKGEDDEAIHYFDLHLPRLKDAEHRPGGKLPEMIECIQYPGETMFVPGGWWHAVQNLDTTIAITENVCNEGNFERVWMQTCKNRKRLAYTWLRLLRHQPHFHVQYRRALEMNVRDRFPMWRPKTISQNKVLDKPHPTWESSASEASISSSTSSDSSVDTSDDELTMEQIRGDIIKRAEKDDAELMNDPRPSKIQRVEQATKHLGNMEIMEKYSDAFPSPAVHFDTDVQRVNHEIKQMRIGDKKKRPPASSSESSSSSNEK